MYRPSGSRGRGGIPGTSANTAAVEPNEIDSGAMLRPATVAIVGRPNVGKSALFNRLVGKRLAIVEDTPGVTRDRLYALCEWQARTFSLVDTAGIDPQADSDSDTIAASTQRQAEAAANEADAIIFVVDASTGRNPLDEDVAAILRRTRRPVVLVANKAESPSAAIAVHGEFSRFGFGEPLAISAIHGEGTGDLLDLIVGLLPEQSAETSSGDELALALVGRPNVGKSSLLNALLNEERTIVSDVPGTTRDAIDTIFAFHEHKIRLIDTAGVWRKPRQHGAIEYYAALRSLNAISRCDIAILLFDAMVGMQAQELRLAGMILEERKGLIIVGNKWDLAREQGEYSQGELINVIHDQAPFAKFAPVTFLSAKSRRRLGSLMPLVMKLSANLDRRIPTAQLNAVVRDATLAHPAPAPSGKVFKILYCSQVQTHPPLFIFHCNDPDLVQNSYKRFLENVLREHFDFEGVPLTFEFRARTREEYT
ncbi:MAG: ribosome biogenesis GTPase Der [Candidatus Eremiobacteraeota bacterium]|nr:ribosome biogenesis GTPase Der [Candidatus Eremiobacteraeota bacterium]